MKRAVVWKGAQGRWWAESCPAHEYRGHRDIYLRITSIGNYFPTHAAALAHALAEVGLTEKNGDER